MTDYFSDWDDEEVTIISESDHDEPGGPTRLAVFEHMRDAVRIVEASGSEITGSVIVYDTDDVDQLTDILADSVGDGS